MLSRRFSAAGLTTMMAANCQWTRRGAMKMPLGSTSSVSSSPLSSTSSFTAHLPRRVKIVEVGPRDGLQNEKMVVPTDVKVQLVNLLSQTGLRVIEAGAFVSPKWVPQMADSSQILQRIERKAGVSYPVLVPNLKGLEAALQVGAEEIAIFGAASEGFSRANINATIAESLARFEDIARVAREKGVRMRGYVSCVISCPYDGPTKPQMVADVARKLLDMGCYEISLGDTNGSGTPAHTARMLDAVLSVIPKEKLALHCHDTYGQALANIYVGLEKGISVVDSSVTGLGGCPYAKGATGNVSTEDVLYMLDGLGIETGVDMTSLLQASRYISTALNRVPDSRAAKALFAKQATSTTTAKL